MKNFHTIVIIIIVEKIMASSDKLNFKSLLKEIVNLPVWIKQVIYMELKEELENSTYNCCINNISKRDLLQLFIPKLTHKGKSILENKSIEYSENIINLLECAFQNQTIMESAVNNGWNLHDCSKYFLKAVNAELVMPPVSPIVKGTALYMSGEIRLGEYYVKVGKISIEELDNALKAQIKLEETLGDKPGLAEILISMGYLTKNETEGILMLKEDCHKSFNKSVES